MINKNKIFSLSIGVCILFLGIICLVIPRAIKSGGDETRLYSQLTDIDIENQKHEWLKKHVVSVLESLDKIQECEADINWSEGEVMGADVKVIMTAGSIGNDTMKTDLEEGISKMLGISTENVKVQLIFPRKSAAASK